MVIHKVKDNFLVRMDFNMQAHLKKVNQTGKEEVYGRQEKNTMANGKTLKEMDMELINLQLGLNMKVNGKITKWMA